MCGLHTNHDLGINKSLLFLLQKKKVFAPFWTICHGFNVSWFFLFQNMKFTCTIFFLPNYPLTETDFVELKWVLNNGSKVLMITMYKRTIGCVNVCLSMQNYRVKLWLLKSNFSFETSRLWPHKKSSEGKEKLIWLWSQSE